MNLEIGITDSPPHDLLLPADESEESVADYIGRGTGYVARRIGAIVGKYLLFHSRPFTAEVENFGVEYQHLLHMHMKIR